MEGIYGSRGQEEVEEERQGISLSGNDANLNIGTRALGEGRREEWEEDVHLSASERRCEGRLGDGEFGRGHCGAEGEE